MHPPAPPTSHTPHPTPLPQDKGEDDWMTRYFFSGGTMPSLDLLLYFPEHMAIQKTWSAAAAGPRLSCCCVSRASGVSAHAVRVRALLAAGREH